MLYRNKKKNDPNAGKWVGIGGKFEEGETAEECLVREVREETGLVLTGYEFKGVIEFRNDSCEDEDMYLFAAYGFHRGEGTDGHGTEPGGSGTEGFPEICCNEGEAEWIETGRILSLNLWEGDRYFLEPLLAGEETINMRLIYSGDRLLRVERINRR